MQYLAKNISDTMKIGKKIAGQLSGGDILCLYGDLGAGKTTLVKGIAAGLGIKKTITSPTFTLMNVYPVKLLAKTSTPLARGFNGAKLVHIDTYRLKDEQELVEIGAEDYLGAPDSICVIEWPEKIKKLLKNKKIVKVTMEHNGKTERKITIL